MLDLVRGASPTCVSLDETAGRHAWSATMADLFVAVDFEASQGGVEGSFRQYEFGELKFEHARSGGSPHAFIRRSWHLREAHVNFYFLGMLLSGSAEIGQSGRRAAVGPDDVFLIDSSQEYSFHVPAAHEAVYIKIPHLHWDSRLALSRRLVGHKIDGNVGLGFAMSRLFRATLLQIDALQPNQASKLAGAMFDLIGAAFVTAEDGEDDGGFSERGRTLRRVQHYIDAHIEEETLSRQVIADHHRVSVRYLNRLFEREGMSLTRWIKARRLERVRQILQDPSLSRCSISEIAYQSGFKNISHFNRAFRDRFGCAPRQLRRSAAPAPLAGMPGSQTEQPKRPQNEDRVGGIG